MGRRMKRISIQISKKSKKNLATSVSHELHQDSHHSLASKTSHSDSTKPLPPEGTQGNSLKSTKPLPPEGTQCNSPDDVITTNDGHTVADQGASSIAMENHLDTITE